MNNGRLFTNVSRYLRHVVERVVAEAEAKQKSCPLGDKDKGYREWVEEKKKEKNLIMKVGRSACHRHIPH